MPANPRDPLICSTADAENQKFRVNPSSNNVEVRVSDEDALQKLCDILAALGGSGTGTPHFAQAQTVTTPGATQTLISEVVPAATTRQLCQVIVTCRQAVQFDIFDGATVIGSGRTGPGDYQTTFKFDPKRDILTGVTLKIEATSLATTCVTDIEVYLMALDV